MDKKDSKTADNKIPKPKNEAAPSNPSRRKTRKQTGKK